MTETRNHNENNNDTSIISTNNNNNNNNNDDDDSGNMQFGKFIIPSSHIFYRTALSGAFVNLRPIVPGHVLVIPQRVTPHLADLHPDEYQDLWNTVRVVQGMLQRYYAATNNVVKAFNVAVQDGRAAGQSVPHVHVHILPRYSDDFERNDEVYDKLEQWAPNDKLAAMTKPKLVVPDDSCRTDRTSEQMAAEAAAYRNLLP